MINWNNIIANLKDGKEITVDPSIWNMSNPAYTEMINLWKSNNFETKNVKWINYYDTKSIEEEISYSLDITPLRSWISCVPPGYMTGYHYDIDDNEEKYLQLGKIRRYSIFASEPAVGHVFILGEHYIYNQPQGRILKWGNYKEWHNGINGSFTPKYMFNILGY